MPFADCRGIATSAESQAEVDRFDDALSLFLNYEAAAGQGVKDLLAQHPMSVMGLVLRGYMTLMIEVAAVQPKIADLAAMLSTEAAHANERERHHIEALGHWATSRVDKAHLAWDRVLADEPLDLLALKMHHYTTFWTGRATALLGPVEGVLDAWDSSTPGHDHVLGMHSFGLNETGQYARAEEVGREAVAINGEDLWSVHAVAHALEMQGDLSGGEDLLDIEPTTMATKNAFVGHIWWHAALFSWNRGDYAAVLRLLDETLLPQSADFYLDIQNVASLLTRLELVGVDVGDRWHNVVEHAAGRIGDHVLAFTDVHCALALGRAGRLDDLETFTASLTAHRATRPSDVDSTGIDLAIVLSHCFAADAEGDPARAASAMAIIRNELAPLGGSQAQRDVFDLLLIDVTRRAGDLAMATNLTGSRSHRWPNSVPTWTTYAEVLAAAGLHDRSASAAQMAAKVAAR